MGTSPQATTAPRADRLPGGPGLRQRAPCALLAPVFLVAVLVVLLLLATPPAASKPIALASPDQVLENMRQIPQWHCLRYRKFDLVTQHKRCRHFRADRKH